MRRLKQMRVSCELFLQAFACRFRDERDELLITTPDLPSDVKVFNAFMEDNLAGVITVVLYSESFDELPEGAPIPRVDPLLVEIVRKNKSRISKQAHSNE